MTIQDLLDLHKCAASQFVFEGAALRDLRDVVYGIQDMIGAPRRFGDEIPHHSVHNLENVLLTKTGTGFAWHFYYCE